MTAVSIPYHLRPNKAIDRYAFLDLLAKVNNFDNKIEQCRYIGFGGFSLEDFKILHHKFGIRKMVSLENNEENCKRQEYNKPISCIEIKHCSSDDYINNFENDIEDEDRTIIWLDYTSPRDIRSQINEFQSCIAKLFALDIIKITLNANPTTLHGGDDSNLSLQESRFKKLTELMEDLLPSNITPEQMTHKEYPKVLFSILKRASNLQMEGGTLCLQPLSCFVYKDGGHEMLTMTAILLEEEAIKEFFTKTLIKQWELSRTNWDDNPLEINLPDLTIKERILIDSLLPDKNIDEIQENIGYLLTNKKEESLNLLKNYVLFYRYTPLFSKVLL